MNFLGSSPFGLTKRLLRKRAKHLFHPRPEGYGSLAIAHLTAQNIAKTDCMISR
jgi:hypothetical protein